MVNKVDSKTLGHKNYIPLEPYLKWVRARAQNLTMPYEANLPIIIEPITEWDVPFIILHADMPTTLEELQRSWIQLKGGWDTFETQFYASEKKVLELTIQLHEEQNLNAYIAPKRMRLWEAWFLFFLGSLFCIIFVSSTVSPRGIIVTVYTY